ncbi:MAG: hypothetical protein ISR77_36750 [Pirellulaceae bacterium]|nr:hypothetical protein [Pirellulaceae bacterium]
MNIAIDVDRGRCAADLLHLAFATSGIHGRTDMPEDIIPEGVQKGTLEHILFITLVVAAMQTVELANYERELRPIVAVADGGQQRRMWGEYSLGLVGIALPVGDNVVRSVVRSPATVPVKGEHEDDQHAGS